MKDIIEKHKNAFIKHAKSEFPREACGVVVEIGSTTRYVPCKNTHPSPTEDFECSIEIADLEDKGFEIVAVFHSHTNGNKNLSPKDIVCLNSCKLPYIMVSIPDEDIVFQIPTQEEISYIGRSYVSGVQDCYTLVQDFYKREFGISLKDFDRRDQFWNNGQDVLTEENMKEAGFYPVHLEEISKGDVVVMRFGRKMNDHLAIYLGNSKILHHCYNRLSKEDVYGGVWLEHTTSIQRYRGHT